MSYDDNDDTYETVVSDSSAPHPRANMITNAVAVAQPHPLMRSRNQFKPMATASVAPVATAAQSVGATTSTTALPYTRPSRDRRSRRSAAEEDESPAEERSDQSKFLDKCQAFANSALVNLLADSEYASRVSPNTFMASVVYYTSGSQTLLMQLSPGKGENASMLSLNMGSYEKLKNYSSDELKDEISKAIKTEAEKRKK
jgi:hypothetical protein